jgi:hypothetical protein
MTQRDSCVDLVNAIRQHNSELVRSLVNQGCDINGELWSTSFTTLATIAAAHGNLSVLEILIDAGAHVDQPTIYGQTPLYLAISLNHDVRVAMLLVDKGASVNTGNEHCETPLHAAARGGVVQIAEFLLDHGASIDAVDVFGHTPLCVAHYHTQPRVAAVLLRRGANMHKRPLPYVYCDRSSNRRTKYVGTFWVVIHAQILDIVIALAALDLPAYVLLWIMDWVPRLFCFADVPAEITEHRKISLIMRVVESIRSVRTK